jgi:hypothetical protein
MTEMDSNGNDDFGVGVFVGVVISCIALFIISCIPGSDETPKKEYTPPAVLSEVDNRIEWIKVCTKHYNWNDPEQQKTCLDFYPRGSVPVIVSNPYQSYTRIDER